MLIVLSPAKSLNFDTQNLINEFTIPVFRAETETLVKYLQKMSAKGLSDLMSISPTLAKLNYERYQTWDPSPEKSKQAILAFDGDVYDGLSASSLKEEILLETQKRVRILSGLYGVLKPLDLIQPHRLEMGTKLKTGRKNDLYIFWKDKIVREINLAIKESESPVLVNLASNEYFKSIDQKKLKGKIVTPEFRDLKNGKYMMISFFAKKARGMMTRFILENGITDPEEMKAFDLEGYNFAPKMSSNEKFVFTRDI